MLIHVNFAHAVTAAYNVTMHVEIGGGAFGMWHHFPPYFGQLKLG
jgi:hypothetical protein